MYYTLKRKLLGPAITNYAGIPEWCTNGQAVAPKGEFPIETHRPFVVDFEINVNERVLQNNFFRTTISTLKRDDWSFSTCTCLTFHKVYMSSHIIGVAIHQKVCFVPWHMVEKKEITT